MTWDDFGLTLVIAFAAQGAMMFLTNGRSLVVMGVSQLVYIVPLVVYYLRKNRRDAAVGVGIFAGVTLLLNAACIGLVSTNFS